MKYVLLTILLGASSLVHAGELSLQLHGLSYHFSDKDYNETNQGLGLRYSPSKDVSFQGGFYENSNGKHTNYALINYTPIQVKMVSVGVFLGAATGYKQAVVPLGGLFLNVQLKENNIGLRFVPYVKGMTPALIAIEAGFKF